MSVFSDTQGFGDLVLVEQFERYAILTINRPEKRNAVNVAAQNELMAALGATEDNVALIFTGAGSVAFCAGVDITERANLSETQGSPVPPRRAWHSDSWFMVQEAILRHPAVCIAAVNGYALGGGLTLVNNCEIAVASNTAEFGMPELAMGAFPALSGPSTLKRILPKRAAYLVLIGERINAEEARAWGLINEVVEPDSLMDRARTIAQRIASFNPVAVDFTKRALREIPSLDWSDAIEYGLRTGSIIRGERQ